MSPLQIFLLIAVSLLGIPVGFLLKYFTKEEMRPGRKWFKMVSIASLAILFGLIVTGENLPLYITAFSFIFFISAVPLLKLKKK